MKGSCTSEIQLPKKVQPAYSLIFGALIGGGKAGNIVSPNPNTIAVTEAFRLDLTAVMVRNLIPAICALIATIVLASLLAKRTGDSTSQNDLKAKQRQKKSFRAPYRPLRAS